MATTPTFSSAARRKSCAGWLRCLLQIEAGIERFEFHTGLLDGRQILLVQHG
jgi:hypothetical protein